MQRPISQLDWNLVPTLHVVLRERNLSRAARQLGVTQPAVSGALNRLRRFFDDELLVRVGQRYELTEFAEQLLPRVAEAQASILEMVEGRDSFDPATAEHEFVLVVSDYGQHVFAPALVAYAERHAPGVSFRFLHLRPGPLAAIQEAIATSDGLVLPRGVLDADPVASLFDDRWVCVVDEDHPEVGDTLTTEEAERLQWVALVLDPRTPALRIIEAQRVGVEPTVAVQADTYTAIPMLVAGTRRVGWVQERLARLLGPSTRTRIVEAPWTSTALRFALWSNPVQQHTPAQQWLHAACAEVGAAMEAEIAAKTTNGPDLG